VDARQATAGHDDVRPADLNRAERGDGGRTGGQPRGRLRRPTERQRIEQLTIDDSFLANPLRILWLPETRYAL
jgi:hypothetical protein